MATPLTSLVIFFMFFFLLDSIAYTFGELGGVISFVFAEDERPNTRNDQLTMGFTTTQLDGLLLRVASAYLNDFIEVELVRDIGHTPPSGYGFHLIRDSHGTQLSMVSPDRASINRRLCFGKPKPNWPFRRTDLRLRLSSENCAWIRRRISFEAGFLEFCRAANAFPYYSPKWFSSREKFRLIRTFDGITSESFRKMTEKRLFEALCSRMLDRQRSRSASKLIKKCHFRMQARLIDCRWNQRPVRWTMYWQSIIPVCHRQTK